MATYFIGYDLNGPRKEDAYPELITAIKKYGTWWHYLDSTWIIKSISSAAEIRDSLSRHLDNTDELLVAELSGNAAWTGFDQKASDWLKSNLSNNTTITRKFSLGSIPIKTWLLFTGN